MHARPIFSAHVANIMSAVVFFILIWMAFECIEIIEQVNLMLLWSLIFQWRLAAEG
jgi:hypothetical protein